ncbi:hypothetical protein [Bartonella harrusi]|nr:hypothetical protein [Bartonella harrusi]
MRAFLAWYSSGSFDALRRRISSDCKDDLKLQWILFFRMRS